jgi:glucose 1-dehydrogenase
MKGLQEKNVLVTGSSSGIGQSIAVRFAQEGANVAVNYRKSFKSAQKTEEMIAQCCQDCGVKALLVQADIAKETDVLRMFDEVIQEFGTLDILVNNSGIVFAAASHELQTEDFDRVVNVNLRGAFLCAREAIKHFLAEDKAGVILNISSVHQIIPKPNYVAYSASKGGMQNLTSTLALEYAGKGIRVNGIGPGATVTPLNQAWIDDPVKRADVEKHIPMGRAGTSEEMAAVAAFLASDEAAYITGQTIFVDGGLTLYPDFRTPWSTE